MSKPERMGDFPRLPGDLERELGDARGILSSCCRCYVDFGVEVVAAGSMGKNASRMCSCRLACFRHFGTRECEVTGHCACYVVPLVSCSVVPVRFPSAVRKTRFALSIAARSPRDRPTCTFFPVRDCHARPHARRRRRRLSPNRNTRPTRCAVAALQGDTYRAS